MTGQLLLPPSLALTGYPPLAPLTSHLPRQVTSSSLPPPPPPPPPPSPPVSSFLLPVAASVAAVGEACSAGPTTRSMAATACSWAKQSDDGECTLMSPIPPRPGVPRCCPAPWLLPRLPFSFPKVPTTFDLPHFFPLFSHLSLPPSIHLSHPSQPGSWNTGEKINSCIGADSHKIEVYYNFPS